MSDARLNLLHMRECIGYAREFDVERYWREVRVMRIAPVTQEMVLNFLGQHELGLPRSC